MIVSTPITIFCAGTALSQPSTSDHISQNGVGAVDGIGTVNPLPNMVVESTHLMSSLTEGSDSSSQFAPAASSLWNVSDAHTMLGEVVAVSLLLLEILIFMFPPGTQLVTVSPLRVSTKGVLAVPVVVAVPNDCAVVKGASSVVEEQPVAICMMMV